MSISYYAPDHGPTYEHTSRVLADEFEKLGLDIELTPIQFSTFVDRVSQGQQIEDLALGSKGGDPDRLDPNFWLLAMSTCESGQNAVKWCDPRFDRLAQAQASTANEKERHDLAWEAQEYFQSKLPWWQVAHQISGIIYNSDRWGGLTPPAPIPPQETVIDPWLNATPTGDDRVLDWGHFEDVSTYNVLAETGSAGWLKFIYDTYLRYDGSEIIPWAVTNWEVRNPTTIDLTLRDGMTFHDGRPVTARDAAFSVNYLKESESPEYAPMVANIAGAQADGELTFTIKLKEPSNAIFSALTALPIMPQHIWQPLDVETVLEWDPIAHNAVIGSGPFMFESWDRNQTHVLNTNQDHWAAPEYEGIRRVALGQADAIRTALIDGSVDLATAVLPTVEMSELGEEEDSLEFLESPTFNTTMVWMNHDKRPFSDYAFRRALRLATNKERVVQEGWLGFARPAGPGPIPKALGDWHNTDLQDMPYDIDQAREVLEDAGYTWSSDGRLLYPEEQ